MSEKEEIYISEVIKFKKYLTNQGQINITHEIIRLLASMLISKFRHFNDCKYADDYISLT